MQPETHKKLDVDSGDVSLTLKRSSWENLFLQLHELGLGTMQATRKKYLIEEYNIFPSEGNFWGAVQELERQYEEVTGDLVTSYEDRR